MNQKRAKALNRIRKGVVRIEDIARLRRTEAKPSTEPKPLPERKKASGNPPTALARAVWGLGS
jgi:hypothetical protein